MSTLDNQILTLLSHGPKDKLWSEREITVALKLDRPVPICTLERLQAASKLTLSLDDNLTYLCRAPISTAL
jgi:hypothetical protein